MVFLLQIHSKHGVNIYDTIERYDSLPDVETVRSTLSVRAVQDLFKNGKLKLRCQATMFSLYRRTKEAEFQEDTPKLALIMVPTTPSNEGICMK